MISLFGSPPSVEACVGLLCGFTASAEMRALLFSAGMVSGLSFLLIALQLLLMRRSLAFVPPSFSIVFTFFIILCGTHGLAQASYTLMRGPSLLLLFDTGLVGAMALTGSYALWLLHFQAPPWLVLQSRSRLWRWRPKPPAP